MGRSLVKTTGPKPSRAEILKLYDQGLSTHEVSKQLLISPGLGKARQAGARHAWEDKEFDDAQSTTEVGSSDSPDSTGACGDS